MSDEFTLTTNYGLKKPNIAADNDVWGAHLNEDLDALDNLLKTQADYIGGPLTVPRLNISDIPLAQPDGSPPVGAIRGDLYNNGGFVCIAP